MEGFGSSANASGFEIQGSDLGLRVRGLGFRAFGILRSSYILRWGDRSLYMTVPFLAPVQLCVQYMPPKRGPKNLVTAPVHFKSSRLRPYTLRLKLGTFIPEP